MNAKRTDLEKFQAASITDRLKKAQVPSRYGRDSAIVHRREQRERDRAQGLIPFALKLNAELVGKIHAKALERQIPLGELVAELLEQGLERAG